LETIKSCYAVTLEILYLTDLQVPDNVLLLNSLLLQYVSDNLTLQNKT